MRQLVIVALLILVTGADDHLDQLARSGNIDENAPVKVSLEITINAAPEKVWGLLSDVKNWPRWQRDISKANISGPLQSGTAFSWTAGVNIQCQGLISLDSDSASVLCDQRIQFGEYHRRHVERRMNPRVVVVPDGAIDLRH